MSEAQPKHEGERIAWKWWRTDALFKPDKAVETLGDTIQAAVVRVESELLRCLQTREADRGAAFEAGMRSVLRQRCIAHRDVPQLNTSAHEEAECGACVQRELRTKLHEARLALKAMLRTHGMHGPCRGHNCTSCQAAYAGATTVVADTAQDVERE